jgi:YggT family protein
MLRTFGPVGAVVCYAIWAYLIVLVLKAVMSWFPIEYDSPMQTVKQVLDKLTEPLLAPLRRVIPPLQIGSVGLDMSFMVLFLGIFLIQTLLC